MTKLAIMSDLHIDINRFGDFECNTLLKVLKQKEVTWLHLAGDISNHHYQVSLPFINQLQKQVKVTYNLGNHDMLDLDESTIEELDFQEYDLGNKTLLAFHGWYDYSFSPDKSIEENLRFKRQFWFDRRLRRPLPDNELTNQICYQLEMILSRQTKPIIIAMHFVPHHHFILTHDTFKPFNAFLGSQKFHDIFKKYAVTDVVFGHAHCSFGSITIDQITYHSRPLGYKREWNLTIDYVSQNPQLNPTGTWNLSKRYQLVKNNDDFNTYLKENLETEFLTSMTLFDLENN